MVIKIGLSELTRAAVLVSEKALQPKKWPIEEIIYVGAGHAIEFLTAEYCGDNNSTIISASVYCRDGEEIDYDRELRIFERVV